MSFQVQLPPDLMASEFELKMIFASKLFEKGLISSGQGAKMIDLSRKAFVELLGKYGVSAFQTDEDELMQDVANA